MSRFEIRDVNEDQLPPDRRLFVPAIIPCFLEHSDPHHLWKSHQTVRGPIFPRRGNQDGGVHKKVGLEYASFFNLTAKLFQGLCDEPRGIGFGQHKGSTVHWVKIENVCPSIFNMKAFAFFNQKIVENVDDDRFERLRFCYFNYFSNSMDKLFVLHLY